MSPFFHFTNLATITVMESLRFRSQPENSDHSKSMSLV